MPRSTDDTDTQGNDTDCSITESLHRKHACCAQKLLAQHQVSHSLSKAGNHYANWENEIQRHMQETGHRQKSKCRMTHCPSCHYSETVRENTGKMRSVDDVEAMLNRCEHLTYPDQSVSTVKQTESNPLPTTEHTHCYQTSTHAHHHGQSSKTRRRHQYHEQRHKTDENEFYAALVSNVVNSGLIRETTEGNRSYITQTPSNKVLRRTHIGNPQQDYLEKKSNPNDEGRVSRCCAQRGGELENRKKSETEHRDLRRSTESQLQSDEELERKFKQKFDLELQMEDRLKTGRTRSMMTTSNHKAKNGNKEPCKNKISFTTVDRKTGFASILADTAACDEHGDVIDSMKEDDASRQLRNITYRKPCRRPSTMRTVQNKTEEETVCNVDKSKNDTVADKQAADENAENIDMTKNIYAGGDLNFYASKNHILSLIDRVLSREFGTYTEDKTEDIAKSELTQRDMCIELTRALQNDSCLTWPQMLSKHRGTSDYTRQLKSLRLEYLSHIQYELRNLYELEVILDNRSPRQTFSMNSNVTGQERNLDERQQQQQLLHDQQQSTHQLP